MKDKFDKKLIKLEKKMDKAHNQYVKKMDKIKKQMDKAEDTEDIKTAKKYLKNRDKMKMFTPDEVWKRLGI